MLEDKKVNLPENARDMPDLVIYFCDGLKEENRLAYVRIKAKDVVEQQVRDGLLFRKRIRPEFTNLGLIGP